MIKRILVALDPDEDTPVATKYAIELAKNVDARLTGLAVVDTNRIAWDSWGGGIGTIYYTKQLYDTMSDTSKGVAEKLLQAFETAVSEAGINHTEVLREGVPYERIIEDMKYHDLLVVGRNAHFFYNHADEDTKTLARLIKKGNAPTLAITEEYHPVKRVLVAFDGSSAAARTLQWFIHLLPFGKNLELELVHVNSDQSEAGRDRSDLLLQQVENYLEVHGFQQINRTILGKGKPGGRLLEHQQSIGADLILLGAHSVSAIRRLTLGSTTHHLMTKSSAPLFLCH
ncbi:universal stress protein [Fodinibius salsisoli]|uniref:Universal stress protein n=1 Tax=Fodinibius salsisoli TaxID=2820877 RepID=A0ABT3PIW7_9BACT|nr:universal stress protein [Fodinibius salsisoli]MCW9705866.1 universal stress protein [Fodinibius salsisoli]